MQWNDDLIRLKSELVKLYPTRDATYPVVRDAGLPFHLIAFNDRASTNWSEIIDVALRQGKALALVRVVLRDYSENPVLQDAERLLLKQTDVNTVPATDGHVAVPRPSEQQKVVNMYYSYALEDAPLLGELEKQLTTLKRTGAIKTWSRQDILPGAQWEHEIARHLDEADIILLLVSPDYLASDSCFYEVQKALKQQRTSRYVRVIPILLRPVNWQDTPFGGLLALPRNGRPVSSHTSRSEALYEIAREIREIVKTIGSSL